MSLVNRIFFLGAGLFFSASNIGEKTIRTKDPIVNTPIRVHTAYYKGLSEKGEYAEVIQDYYLDLNNNGKKQENEPLIGEHFYIEGASPYDSSNSTDF